MAKERAKTSGGKPQRQAGCKRENSMMVPRHEGVRCERWAYFTLMDDGRQAAPKGGRDA